MSATDILRIRAHLATIKARAKYTEIRLHVATDDPIIDRLVHRTGSDCLIGLVVLPSAEGVVAGADHTPES